MKNEIAELRKTLICDSDGLVRLGVGSQLARIIHEEFSGSVTARVFFPNDNPECGCSELARDMDSWGTDGCESNRDVIIAAIVKNGVKASVLGLGVIASGAMKTKAEHWLTEAIRRVRVNTPVMNRLGDIAKQEQIGVSSECGC